MSTRVRKRGICVCCGRPGAIEARGLKEACYTRAYRAGTLDDYPRWVRPTADVIADIERLKHGEGCTWKQVAKRLGYSSLHSAASTYYRAKKQREVKP